MQLANTVKQDLNISTNVNLEEQKSFLETNLGKVINTALDTGIRAVLPDIIEDQIINIKNEIINNGFKAGVQEAISSAIDLGKSTIGIFTGKFENVTQVRNAVKNGGIIDGISKALDCGLNICSKFGKIPSTISTVLRSGKNVILDTISRNIEKEFNNQLNSIEKIENYSQKWREHYNSQNFAGMEKEYKKIGNELKKILPLENTINNARKIENIHTLIKNKGENFNLSKEEIELAEKLIN